jgi:hypothetical protein
MAVAVGFEDAAGSLAGAAASLSKSPRRPSHHQNQEKSGQKHVPGTSQTL